MVGGDGAVGK
ncbi:Cell division protein FtsA [Caballeronia sordidicola]|uniref:Cell division protein FtsA n=1 Tax=Caballeronia sordidicola TaxID=196367 RepID=A0A226WZ08_CABSO|nr:Cell division protein FtsA [Caballeronia sordidicola]